MHSQSELNSYNMDINCSTPSQTFPFEIKDIDQKTMKELMRHFTGEFSGFVQVGPKGYVLPKGYEQSASTLYNLPVRRDDTFVVTFPRSGTTLTQELVWLIANDLDFDKAAQIPLVKRFPFVEHSALCNNELLKIVENDYEGDEERLKMIRESWQSTVERIGTMPSPRFIKSHLPPSLFPPNLLDAKVVFVARDPRDVAVSCYYHNRLIRMRGFEGDFKTYWNFFVRDLVNYSPINEYNKETWALRNHPNVLFLFYEDLIKELRTSIKRIAKFLEKELTQEQLDRLCDHVQVDKFRNNKSVNETMLRQLGMIKPGEEPFIRKGIVGGWHEYFDEEMAREAEKWIENSLRDTDFKYPNF